MQTTRTFASPLARARVSQLYDAIMRAVVQRVSRAEVRIDGRVAGKIARGFVVLLGVADGDTDADAAFLVDRIVGMRIFADAAGKMNLALAQVEGSLLVVSQFTLLADTNSGRRPSFTKAAPPDEARRLYQHFSRSRAFAVLKSRPVSSAPRWK